MARMNDRGQILLIGAITIAVTFISMAIVLNGSLHTPSIAADASDHVTGTELEKVRDTIRQETTGLVQEANDNYATLSDPEAIVRQNITALGASLESYYAHKDVALTVTPSGTGIGFVTHVSKSLGGGPASIDYPNTELRYFNLDPISLGSSDQVTIEFTDTGTGSSVEVEVTRDEIDVVGVPASPCMHGGRVEVTNATTANGACPQLDVIQNFDDSYSVTVSHTGLSGSLEYSLVARGSYPGSDWIYAVNVPIEYRSPSTTFIGNLTVRSGEP